MSSGTTTDIRGRAKSRGPSSSKNTDGLLTRSQSRRRELDHPVASGSNMSKPTVKTDKGTVKTDKGKGKLVEVETRGMSKQKPGRSFRSTKDTMDTDADKPDAGTTLKAKGKTSSKRKGAHLSDDDDDDGQLSESGQSKDSERSRDKKRTKNSAGTAMGRGGVRIKDLEEDPRDEDGNWPELDGDIILVSFKLINILFPTNYNNPGSEMRVLREAEHVLLQEER